MENSVHVKCAAELQFIRPKIIEDLCRIGNRADGGYVMTIAAINKSEVFISLGLDENWSFEDAIS